MDEFKTKSFMFKGPVERRVKEKDISALINLFKLNWGNDYVHPTLYNDRLVKRDIYSDEIVWIVIEEEDGNGGREIIASGALILGEGDYDDQIGELARWVVHPEHKGKGLARRIVNGLLRAAEGTIEFAFGLCRAVHPISQTLMDTSGYSAIGFLPQYYAVGDGREGGVFYANLYGNGRELRRMRPPQIIPEAAPLARHALAAMKLPDSLSIVECKPYSDETRYSLKSMDRSSIIPLLRIKHGRLIEPLLFGSLSLEQGMWRIRRRNTHYLMAVDENDTPVGAIGYQVDAANGLIKASELIAEDEGLRGELCGALVQEAVKEWDAQVIEVNVSAYDARLQRTFYDLGFCPAVYAPAMVFHGTGRLDVVKMLKLNFPYQSPEMKLTDAAREVVVLVEDGFKGKP